MPLRFPLTTERLLMRPFAEEDLAALHAIYSDPAVERWIGPFRSTDRTRRELEHNLRHQAEHGFAFWAVEERDRPGRLVGEAGLNLLEGGPEVEVGYTLRPDVWGRGYATELARACIALAFEELGVDRVVAVVKPRNAASRRVLEKAGLTSEGRRMAYGAEHVLYATTRSSARRSPRATIS